jgi:hypothetical protein
MKHDQAVVDCLRAAKVSTIGNIDALCPGAAALEPAVIATNIAFQKSALSVDQAAMFALIFQSYINPGQTPKMVADMTENIIMPAHSNWTAAFGCGNGAAPNDQTAQFWRQVHQLGHSLRAMPVGPGQVMETARFDTPCIEALANPSGVDNCPLMTAAEYAVSGLPPMSPTPPQAPVNPPTTTPVDMSTPPPPSGGSGLVVTSSSGSSISQISISSAALASGSATKSFNIAGNAGLSWSVTSDQAWLMASPSSGAGNATVQLTATLHLMSFGNNTATVTVSSNQGSSTFKVVGTCSSSEQSICVGR